MRSHPSSSTSIAWLIFAAVLAVRVAAAAESLRQRVDEIIAAKAGAQPLAAPASDAEFLRRAWLDFSGNIPSADETKKFLADPAPNKRSRPRNSAHCAKRRDAARRASRFSTLRAGKSFTGLSLASRPPC